MTPTITIYPERCRCGHLLARHMYREPPHTFDPNLPDPELEFTHCAGMAPHKGIEQRCICSGYDVFPFGLYLHTKTNNLYEAVDLAFDAGDRTIFVEYVSIAYHERWVRPIHAIAKGDGFEDPDNAGVMRFIPIERLTDEQQAMWDRYVNEEKRST